MMSKFTTKLTTIVAALGLAGLCSCSDEAGIRWAGNGGGLAASIWHAVKKGRESES